MKRKEVNKSFMSICRMRVERTYTMEIETTIEQLFFDVMKQQTKQATVLQKNNLKKFVVSSS